MNEKQRPFEFGAPPEPEKEELKPEPAPVRPLAEREEYDDSPHAERRQQRSQYDQNLKNQRANLGNAPKPRHPKLIGHPGRFAKPPGLETKIAAGAAVDAHRKKQFDRFYRSMGYDEKTAYARKPVTERDELFERWLRGQK